MTSKIEQKNLFIHLDALCFEYKLLDNISPEKNVKLLANSPIDENVKLDIIYDNVLQSLKPYRCNRSTPSLIKKLHETINILEKLDDVDYIALSTISNIAISAFQIDLMKRLSSIYEKINITEWDRPIDNDLYVIESAASQFAGYYYSIYDAVVNDKYFHKTPHYHISNSLQFGDYNLFTDINLHLIFNKEKDEDIIRINRLIANSLHHLPKDRTGPSDYFKGFSEVPYDRFAENNYPYLLKHGVLFKEIGDKSFKYNSLLLEKFISDPTNNQASLASKAPIDFLLRIQNELLREMYEDDLEVRCLEKITSSFVKAESGNAILKQIKPKDFELNINEFYAITGRQPTITEIISHAEDQLIYGNEKTFFDIGSKNKGSILSFEDFNLNELLRSLYDGVLKAITSYEPKPLDEIKEPLMRGLIFIKKNNPFGSIVKALSPPQDEIQALMVNRIDHIDSMLSDIEGAAASPPDKVDLNTYSRILNSRSLEIKKLNVYMNTIMMLSDFASRSPQNLMQTCVQTDDINDFWPVRLRSLINRIDAFETDFSKRRMSIMHNIINNGGITITQNSVDIQSPSLIKNTEIKNIYHAESGFKKFKEYISNIAEGDPDSIKNLFHSDVFNTYPFHLSKMDDSEREMLAKDILHTSLVGMITFDDQIKSFYSAYLKKISSTMFKSILNNLVKSEEVVTSKEINKIFTSKKYNQDKEYSESAFDNTL